MSIYIIRRLDFDNMENRSSGAMLICDIGAVPSLEDAKKMVMKYTADIQQYEGWDKEQYPQFFVAEIPEITNEHLHHSCTEKAHVWHAFSTNKRVCLACGELDFLTPSSN